MGNIESRIKSAIAWANKANDSPQAKANLRLWKEKAKLSNNSRLRTLIQQANAIINRTN